jgi:hypothetical protein
VAASPGKTLSPAGFESRLGTTPAFAAIEEGDPLDLANVEQAADEFRAAILRLSPNEPDTG